MSRRTADDPRDDSYRFQIRNPFHDLLVSELLDDPTLYREMFSERVLVGESLQVFQPANVVLLGAQGTGKSMILNLVLWQVISAWISKNEKPPSPLKNMRPYFGILINLVKAKFHAFGRRSLSREGLFRYADQSRDPASAADYINHYLFHEFLKGLVFLRSEQGERLRSWTSFGGSGVSDRDIVSELSSWKSWFGYYRHCQSMADLLEKSQERLYTWLSFLNTNIDEVPQDVWETKSEIGEPLQQMGKLLNSMVPKNKRLPLFVVIDQYEALPELNKSHGTSLQRVVNTLIKARDPNVFYKLGARTYDWGNELRIWGSESRIEVQRDYRISNLSDVLMRREDRNRGGWIFQHFARDVAHKRLMKEGYKSTKEQMKRTLGTWSPGREAELYFRNKTDASRKLVVIKDIPSDLGEELISVLGPDASPIDLRLGSAWILQRKQRGVSEKEIAAGLSAHPWKAWSWRKERIEIALLQIASLANQERRYFGWDTVLFLAGGNITSLLLICSEIWDTAAKFDRNPMGGTPLDEVVQSVGIHKAAEHWSTRDKNENIGGSHRYEVLGRLGPAIHEAVIRDLAISNPGHSGFSVREADLLRDDKVSKAVATFLKNAVSWAILEERPHTSKFRDGATRRKWYLHQALSPAFEIPYKRVKEPFYIDVESVYRWIFTHDKIVFGASKARSRRRGRTRSILESD